MKQKLKRFMAGFMAVLTMVMTLFTNGSTAFAASPQANIAFWYASTKNSGEVSELKAGYNHGKILYSILDGNSAYCMNFGLKADGGQLMNSYDETSTSMSTEQRKLLSYCLYYGFNSTQKAAPSNSQCDEYIATQAMVWIIVANIFGTGSGDSAAQKLCNTAPNPTASYNYYESLKSNISSSYNATLPSFASRTGTGAPTYELKWNEANQRFETTLSDSNGVLGEFDFSIDGYSVSKNGNSITIASANVNTNATKKALSEAQQRLNDRCEQIKSQVFEVKSQVKATAKSIVSEAKVKGRAALYRVSEFLGIKNKLLTVRENVRSAIKETDRNIARTALLGKGLREAGQTAVNAFRTFADKPEVNFLQKEQKHMITKAVLAPMKAVRKMFVSMELHLDASIDKLDNLAMNVQIDKEKRMENVKSEEQNVPVRTEAEPERVNAEIVYAPMVAEAHEYQYNADAFEARGGVDVKMETTKEPMKVREDKAR